MAGDQVVRKTRKETKRDSIRRIREQKRASGRILVTTDLPGDLIEKIDALKESRGVRGRTPIIEEAIRTFFAAKSPS